MMISEMHSLVVYVHAAVDRGEIRTQAQVRRRDHMTGEFIGRPLTWRTLTGGVPGERPPGIVEADIRKAVEQAIHLHMMGIDDDCVESMVDGSGRIRGETA